jgi:polyhydroxyalkanoate synthesis repressor PhaR
MEREQDPAVVLIRRYPNRRLYDTHASRYVTLEDLAALIDAGREVRVVDARSGEEVTQSLLLQLVVQLAEREGSALMQPALLHRLIRARRVIANPALHGTLTWMLDTLTSAQDPAGWRPPSTRAERTEVSEPAPTLEGRVAALEQAVAKLLERGEGG